VRLCYTDEMTGVHRLRGFTSAFQPDLTVGPAGEREVPMHCTHMGADAAGHLYLGLDADDAVDGEIHLLRTATSGVVDTGWAESGEAIVSRATLGIAFPDESPGIGRAFGTAASPIAALPDGSLYLAARVTRDGLAWSAAIVKLAPDGSLDPGFDADGIRAFGPSGGPSHIAAFTVDAQGRPIVSAVYGAPGARKAYLLRLTADGRFDLGFGRGGLIPQTFTATSLAVDGSGRILSAAGDGTNVIVARRSGS
jgi:hypothetical protein